MNSNSKELIGELLGNSSETPVLQQFGEVLEQQNRNKKYNLVLAVA